VALAGVIAMQAFWISLTLKNNRIHMREHLVLITAQNEKRLCKLLSANELTKAEKELEQRIKDDLTEMGSPLCFKLKILKGSHPKAVSGKKGEIFIKLHCDSTVFPHEVYIRCNTNSWLKSGQIFWWTTASILMIALIAFSILLSILNQRKFKKLEKIKSDFVSNMTHELKTPIATISVASEMLMKDDNPYMNKEKAARYARIIYDENNRLKRLVDRVLQLAIFERGDNVYKFGQADLHKIINEGIKRAAMLLKEKNGTITTSLEAKKTFFKCDKSHISNVVLNILENSIKYSATPKIKVTTQDTADGIIITFSDLGPGIPDEKKQEIFGRFSRGELSDVHNVKGFGIGLYYVKKVVESHGGTIEVADNHPTGAVFKIYFPGAYQKH
jgi:K+-sensing histidine kinase KdpD